MGRIEGRIAVITGAGRGIGLAAARRFVAEGAKVLLVDSDADAATRAAATLGPEALACSADVTEAADYRRIADTVLSAWGGLDIVLLNAGIVGKIGAIDELPVTEFDRVMAVNVRGVWLGLATLMPLLRARGGGSVVVTASTGGKRGAAGMAAYSTSKHAVIGLVKSAALEGAPHGIRVNAVCPAPIDTAMMAQIAEGYRPGEPELVRAGTTARIPLGRYGQPEEVAALMLYLASDEAAFVTGSAHLIDGGVMAGAVR